MREKNKKKRTASTRSGTYWEILEFSRDSVAEYHKHQPAPCAPLPTYTLLNILLLLYYFTPLPLSDSLGHLNQWRRKSSTAITTQLIIRRRRLNMAHHHHHRRTSISPAASFTILTRSTYPRVSPS